MTGKLIYCNSGETVLLFIFWNKYIYESEYFLVSVDNLSEQPHQSELNKSAQVSPLTLTEYFYHLWILKQL